MIRSALFIALTFLPTIANAASDAPPNVLLIITDEHNFRTLGCYRELMPREQAEMWGIGAVVKTPHIDRLAEEGVICTRAYATAPTCTPCRASIFTGLYPHATGAPKHNMTLDSSLPTIATRLSAEGYRTGYVGKWHLGGEGKPEWAPKVDGGFQFKKFMFNRGHWKKFVMENGEPAVGSRQNGEPNYNVDGAEETSFATDWLTDRAIEFITDSEQAKPYFAVISYPDPHGPNSVRAPYDHRFDELPFTPPRTFQLGNRPPTPRWMGDDQKHDVFRGDEMSKYFGMVQCIDDNVGRLMARLKETNRLDNTLIVFTSDHGDLCYEHDRVNKGNPYEGSARVPMILRFPNRIASGEYFVQPVGSVDITPTVLGFLGLPGKETLHGRDLSDQLADASKANVDADPQTTFVRSGGMRSGWVTAVDARYKLVLSVNDIPWLFDKQQDPDELHNFYGRSGTEAVAKRLGEALRQYSIDTKDPAFEQPPIAESLTQVLTGKPLALGSRATPDKQSANTRPLTSRGSEKPNLVYRSKWDSNRLWIGPDWWANPMMDWSMRGGKVIAPASADRTLCLLTTDLGPKGDSFSVSVDIELAATAPKPIEAAGFRIGRKGGIDDYRHALVHATDWIDATIRGDGKLSLGDSLSEETLPLGEGPATLKLTGVRTGDHVTLVLSASRGEKSIRVEQAVLASAITGGVSLLTTGPKRPSGSTDVSEFKFKDFRLDGDIPQLHPDRSFGPILWSQYTLSDNQLRLQAQFAPLGTKPNYRAELWIADTDGEPQWSKVATEPMDKLSRTVRFTINDWPSDTEKLYQVRFRWRGQQHVWDGRVRREPTVDEPFKLGCFSCDNGYLFPIPAMVQQVKRQNPDMVFFAGDQIYESYGGFGTNRTDDTETAMIDYLRKFYQFGWTWRDVLRDRPSVILPDDHDVFQGNIWGHGGRKLPKSESKNNWTLGGYLMPGDWINAVEKTNVGHLPDPAVDMTLPIGIKPYFTSMNYGGVGFAILEDRKFKTGPMSISEANRKDGDGASLLGEEQEAFLKRWAEDWSGQQMKCALSQTIFCTAATHTNHNLKRTRSYFDSGAWPKAARNRAVRILGDCNALAIHGDQHLGVLLRHGVDDFDDAGYAFMVPGTANGFPRAWWPGVNKGVPQPGRDFTGKFHDDAGHPIHVLAVGNPEPGSNLLPKSKDPMEVGYRKGSGYGMVEFDRQNKTAKISMYRLGNKEEMFEGFPQTVTVGGKP
jgi:arylsulfatase A-like enzyme